jgi:putative addiction module component (TIGR02574 family)
VTAEAKKILQDALTLPDEERLMVAEELFHSVDEATHAEVDDALRSEILRRVQQVRNGEVELVSWDTVREQGREALARRRR